MKHSIIRKMALVISLVVSIQPITMQANDWPWYSIGCAALGAGTVVVGAALLIHYKLQNKQAIPEQKKETPKEECQGKEPKKMTIHHANSLHPNYLRANDTNNVSNTPESQQKTEIKKTAIDQNTKAITKPVAVTQPRTRPSEPLARRQQPENPIIIRTTIAQQADTSSEYALRSGSLNCPFN